MAEIDAVNGTAPGRARWSGRQKITGILVAIGALCLIWLLFAFVGSHPPKAQADDAPGTQTYGEEGDPLPKTSVTPAVQHVAPPARNYAPILPDAALSISRNLPKWDIFAKGGQQMIGAQQGGTTPVGGRGVSPAPAADGNGALNRELQSSTFAEASASIVKNPELAIEPGTVIHCITNFAIDTTLPGEIVCHLPDAVRGEAAGLPLLDAGTKIVGFVHQIAMQGIARAFITWDTAWTPEHVQITLRSPGADALGRSGIPGNVDNHWWAQIKSAVLFSLIGGGFQTATSALSGNAFIEQFGASGNSVAAQALNHEIPPTLTLPQGADVSIIVARQLDFSKVYRLLPAPGAR